MTFLELHLCPAPPPSPRPRGRVPASVIAWPSPGGFYKETSHAELPPHFTPEDLILTDSIHKDPVSK